MRTKAFALVLAVACTFLASIVRADNASQNFVGVWSSERSFGPHIDGSAIVLRRSDDTWNAHIGFEDLKSVASQNTASFRFSDGEFRVRYHAGNVIGQWIQPNTVTSGYRFATPVVMMPSGQDMWLGRVHPLPDVQHMYLFVRTAPGGTLTAFIRNPENNEGARIGTRRVNIAGNIVRLRKEGTRDIVGRLDARDETLTFHFDGYPDDFIFKKSAEAPVAEYSYKVPARIGDGWQTAGLHDVRLDAAKIAALMRSVEAPPATAAAPYIQSVLVARYDKLVLDEYFNDFTIDRPHDVRSAGKSVTTLLLGRAMQGGTLGAQAPIYLFFPQYIPFGNDDPRKQAITVAHLMTMSSGYACNDNDEASPGNEDTMESQTAQPDWYKYTLDLPIVAEPGTKAVYCSASINLLGGIISRTTNAWLPDYFYDTFAQPMQFRQYGMWLTPPPLDTAYMAGGDYFLPRDFLKFGQLFLDHGHWHGNQIVDNAWLVESSKPWVSLNSPGDYGYGWHLYTYTVNGRRIKAISAGGNGGQLLFAFPQLDMTVMITAANYGQYPVWQKFVTELIPKLLSAAQ